MKPGVGNTIVPLKVPAPPQSIETGKLPLKLAGAPTTALVIFRLPGPSTLKLSDFWSAPVQILNEVEAAEKPAQASTVDAVATVSLYSLPGFVVSANGMS